MKKGVIVPNHIISSEEIFKLSNYKTNYKNALKILSNMSDEEVYQFVKSNKDKIK